MFYNLYEQDAHVAVYATRRAAARLRQIVPSLPPKFTSSNLPRNSHDRRWTRFLYVANRLHNAVSIFAAGATVNCAAFGLGAADSPRGCA